MENIRQEGMRDFWWGYQVGRVIRSAVDYVTRDPTRPTFSIYSLSTQGCSVISPPFTQCAQGRRSVCHNGLSCRNPLVATYHQDRKVFFGAEISQTTSSNPPGRGPLPFPLIFNESTPPAISSYTLLDGLHKKREK